MNHLTFNGYPDASEAVAIVKPASGFTRTSTGEDSTRPELALQRRCPRILWTAAGVGRLAVLTLLLVTQVMAANEALTTVDPVEGRILWNKKFHVGFKAGDPVLAPGGVFFSSVESGGIFVTLPETGEPKHVWSNRRLGAVTGTPVLVGGQLFGVCGGADGKGALTCFEPSTGKTLWSRPGFGWGSLLAAGDRLVVLSEKGEVSVVRATATEGEVLARFQALGGKCWSAPSLADGRLYIRNAKGSLVAFDLTTPRTAAVTSPRRVVSE